MHVNNCVAMTVFYQKRNLKLFLESKRKMFKTTGLVPTMGALHEGHISLVLKALKQNNLVVVSVFVNPTQFNNKQDLEHYPRTLENDVNLLKSIDENIVVFAPSIDEMYSHNITSKKFDFDGLDNEMEGKHRKGHFDGVATVVEKLFDIVTPNNAYFGEKDFQQLQIIKKLVTKLELTVNIVGCPITREENGLAMSSRNKRLPAHVREKAAFIYETLLEGKHRFESESLEAVIGWIKKMFKSNPDFSLEYVTIADENTLVPLERKGQRKPYRLFIAVYANDVRLIDNIALN